MFIETIILLLGLRRQTFSYDNIHTPHFNITDYCQNKEFFISGTVMSLSKDVVLPLPRKEY